MSDDVLVKVENVSKKFCRSLKKSLWYGLKDLAAESVGGRRNHDYLRPAEFWAVNDVSFELRRGECLGLIGRNGAGKTTLLKMLNGLIKPDKGRIEMRGRVGALIALGAGFNPILTGRENIYVNGSVLGLSKKEIDDKIEEIIDFADIQEFIDAPVQSYSSGMHVRLGFAVTTALEPDILLVDEILAVGDAPFQAKCFQRMSDLISNQKCTVVLVSHYMAHIARICDKAIFLNHGKTIEYGDTSKVIQSYRSHGSSETDTGNEYDKPSGADLGKVSISGVSIKNGQGVETNKSYSGDSCRIEVSYFALEQIKNPIVTISFTSIFDGLMSHYSTKGNLDHFSLNGDGVIALDIFYLGLSSGKWKIGVGIFDHDNIKPFTWKWFIAEIDVFEPENTIMLGRFRMPFKWEIK